MYKISELVEELKKQDCYKNFIKDNKDAFLCAGFFVMNSENGEGEDKFQLDFYIPKKKLVAISEYPFKEIKIQKDKIDSMMSVDEAEIQVDLPDLESIIEEEKEKNKIIQQAIKIIAVLKDGMWNITSMSATLDLVRIKVSALNGQVLKFERVGLMDFVRVEKRLPKSDKVGDKNQDKNIPYHILKKEDKKEEKKGKK